MDNEYVNSFSFKAKRILRWLKECSERGITVCSICSGALPGHAGLLKDTECTTHWRRWMRCRSSFPQARVLADILYIKKQQCLHKRRYQRRIDLCLAIPEDLKEPCSRTKGCTGLVVYHRRSGRHKQQSVYLDYRNHINPQVHEVQDYLIDNLSKENDIETLASLVGMSPVT